MIPAWLLAWWPAIVWACLIFSLSTDSFSAEHTSRIIVPLLHWIFPHLDPEQIETYHHYIRKTAHFSEYFVFYLLLFRGVRAGRTGWRWTWGLAALAIAAGYSALDQPHGFALGFPARLRWFLRCIARRFPVVFLASQSSSGSAISHRFIK
jgi:VanZ family protein